MESQTRIPRPRISNQAAKPRDSKSPKTSNPKAGVWNWREAQTTNPKPGTINQKAKVWYLNSGIGLSKQRNEKLGIQSRDSKTRDKSRGPGPGISTQSSGSRSHNGTDGNLEIQASDIKSARPGQWSRRFHCFCSEPAQSVSTACLYFLTGI